MTTNTLEERCQQDLRSNFEADSTALTIVAEMCGRKTAEDIKERIDCFSKDPANGDLFGKAMFAHGVVWACTKIKEQQLKRSKEMREAEVHPEQDELYHDHTYKDAPDSFVDEDGREAVREIYQGMTYRYYLDDISIQFKGISYVNAMDEEGNIVVLQLKEGTISGVAKA